MKWLERIALALGALLFVWLVRRIGVETILGTLGRLGWGFLAVVALAGLTAAVNTLAWRAAMPAPQRVPFGPLFGFLLAGDGVNALTPSAVVGGELVRLGLLRRKLDGVSAAASVALAAGCQFLAQVLFIAAGLPFALLAGATLGGAGGRAAVAGAAAVAAAAAVVGTALVLSRRRGVFETLHRFAARFLPGGLGDAGGSETWKALDDSIFGAIRSRRRDLAVSIALYAAGWTMGVAEVALVLSLLGVHAGVAGCIAIEALSVLVDTVFFFVPARLGTQEGGKYVIAGLLGIDPAAGFGLGLIRRLRETFWALVGLGVLAYWQRRPGERLTVRSDAVRRGNESSPARSGISRRGEPSGGRAPVRAGAESPGPR